MPPTQETQLRYDKSLSIDAKGGRGMGGGGNALYLQMGRWGEGGCVTIDHGTYIQMGGEGLRYDRSLNGEGGGCVTIARGTYIYIYK